MRLRTCSFSSWPGLSRPSTSLAWTNQDVDARHEGGHGGARIPNPLPDRKTIARKAALVRRDAIPAAERAQAAETIAARAFPLAISPDTIVSGFMPLKT